MKKQKNNQVKKRKDRIANNKKFESNPFVDDGIRKRIEEKIENGLFHQAAELAKKHGLIKEMKKAAKYVIEEEIVLESLAARNCPPRAPQTAERYGLTKEELREIVKDLEKKEIESKKYIIAIDIAKRYELKKEELKDIFRDIIKEKDIAMPIIKEFGLTEKEIKEIIDQK